jgi:hypothetical protein
LPQEEYNEQGGKAIGLPPVESDGKEYGTRKQIRW